MVVERNYQKCAGYNIYLACPHFRHTVVVDAVEHGLECLGHDHQSLESFPQIHKGRVNYFEETVIADDLLNQNSVHRLLVFDWVLFHDFRQRQWFWYLVNDLLSNLVNNLWQCIEVMIACTCDT